MATTVSVKIKNNVGYSGGTGSGASTSKTVTLRELVELSEHDRIHDDGTTINLTVAQFKKLVNIARIGLTKDD